MDQNTTSEKIIISAIGEFSRHGFDGARIDRIAKKARVNKAMIYYHFKGKEDLYEKILLEIYQKIYGSIVEKVKPEAGPEQLYEIIRAAQETTSELGPDFARIMMRELASGGAYFRKLAIPNLITPVIKIVTELFISGQKKGLFKEIDPIYTYIQVMGAIVFFNIIRVAVEGTDLAKLVFRGNDNQNYSDNLIKNLKFGIEKEGSDQ